MTIPLMATSMLAFGVSRLVCRRPLYGALARRMLLALEREQAPEKAAKAAATLPLDPAEV
jgi:H+/Cl- antiporter ClcA